MDQNEIKTRETELKKALKLYDKMSNYSIQIARCFWRSTALCYIFEVKDRSEGDELFMTITKTQFKMAEEYYKNRKKETAEDGYIKCIPNE